MAIWMTYSVLVSALLIAPALAVEALCRAGGLPRRWGWMAVMCAMLALPAVALLRAGPALDGAVEIEVTQVERSEGVSLGAPSLLERTSRAAAAVVQAPLRGVLRRVPEVPDRVVTGVWLGLSLGLLGLGGAVTVRYRSARARWPHTTIAGRPVRVAPGAGPAVLGIVRPEVVVPAWLLDRSEAEQRLVVDHEHEHVRARDPLLLGAACLVAASMAWNPVVWWALHRLRLAVEVDCDARVLRRGARKSEYGMMLIDVAGRTAGLNLGGAAFAGPSSSLERRLTAMTHRTTRSTTARALGLAAIGGAAVLAACEARMPTAAEIEAMDAAAVESSVQRLALTDAEGDVTYLIDGTAASAEEARALEAAEIGSVEVTRGPEGGTVHIRTRSSGAAGPEDGATRHFRLRATPGAGAHGEPDLAFSDFEGILFIDGERADASRLRTLPRGEIARVEVLKGDAAVRIYGEEASAGVIRITTRAATPGS